MDEETLSACRAKAAQAWCTENTSHIPMESDLADAFAHILYEAVSHVEWLSLILEHISRDQSEEHRRYFIEKSIPVREDAEKYVKNLEKLLEQP